jgi:hypothetical protein
MYTNLTLITLSIQLIGASAAGAAGQLDLRWKDFTPQECRVENDMGRLDVTGTLVYKNQMREPILLLRQPHTTVGLRARRLNAGPTEQPSYPFIPLVVNKTREKSYQKEDFVLVEAGESYSEHYSFGMFFATSENGPLSSLPQLGTYLIQVEVSVWPDSSNEAKKVDAALGKGHVWTEYLWSEPIQIELRSDLMATNCR